MCEEELKNKKRRYLSVWILPSLLHVQEDTVSFSVLGTKNHQESQPLSHASESATSLLNLVPGSARPHHHKQEIERVTGGVSCDDSRTLTDPIALFPCDSPRTAAPGTRHQGGLLAEGWSASPEPTLDWRPDTHSCRSRPPIP